MQPSGAPALVDKESQPDAYWTPLHEPVLYEGQVFHLGDWASWIGGFDLTFRARLMLNDHTISEFACLNDEKLTTQGACARGDWMDKLGLKPDDVVTMEDFHNMVLSFQSNFAEHPLVLYDQLDPHRYMSAFDTISSTTGTGTQPIAPLFTKDGKVQVANSTEGDKNYMTTISTWYAEGLINPNWMNWNLNKTFVSDFMENKVGVTSMLPSEGTGYVNLETTPEAYFIGLHEPVLYKGQVFHLGDIASWIQGLGNWAIGTHCENIPPCGTPWRTATASTSTTTRITSPTTCRCCMPMRTTWTTAPA